MNGVAFGKVERSFELLKAVKWDGWLARFGFIKTTISSSEDTVQT